MAKILVKYAWERGALCYINGSRTWGRERRVYGSTKHFYPRFDLNCLTEEEAVERLVYYYLGAFGPASFGDLCWWSGISVRKLRQTIVALGKKCRVIRIDGFAQELLLLDVEVDKLADFRAPREPWVTLLAYEDPTPKGYFETRYRYVNSAIYRRVFNQIGEIRPTVVVDGQVVGTWFWARREGRIRTRLLRAVDGEVLKRMREVVENTERVFSAQESDKQATHYEWSPYATAQL